MTLAYGATSQICLCCSFNCVYRNQNVALPYSRVVCWCRFFYKYLFFILYDFRLSEILQRHYFSVVSLNLNQCFSGETQHR